MGKKQTTVVETTPATTSTSDAKATLAHLVSLDKLARQSAVENYRLAAAAMSAGQAIDTECLSLLRVSLQELGLSTDDLERDVATLGELADLERRLIADVGGTMTKIDAGSMERVTRLSAIKLELEKLNLERFNLAMQLNGDDTQKREIQEEQSRLRRSITAIRGNSRLFEQPKPAPAPAAIGQPANAWKVPNNSVEHRGSNACNELVFGY